MSSKAVNALVNQNLGKQFSHPVFLPLSLYNFGIHSLSPLLPPSPPHQNHELHVGRLVSYFRCTCFCFPAVRGYFYFGMNVPLSREVHVDVPVHVSGC